MLVTVVIVAGGLWYVMNLKADLVQARENQKKLEDGVREQQALIERMKRDVVDIQRYNKELQDLSNTQRAEVDALSKKFSQDAKGQPRDFGSLSIEKPELIQRLVNRGTRNAMRCLEIASGAPRTQEEIDAKSSSEINKECPSLANPNYKPGTTQ